MPGPACPSPRARRQRGCLPPHRKIPHGSLLPHPEIDALNGTGVTDLFTGGANGLQTADTIVGDGGRDVLNSGVVQEGTQAPTMTSTTATNDRVRFEFDGQVQNLKLQAQFEDFYDANQASGRVTADVNTDTLTVEADSGTIVLNVSDADFLLA